MGKGHVAAVKENEQKEMADELSILRTGEAIANGEAVRIPSRIRFFHAANSTNYAAPIASKLWSNSQPNVNDMPGQYSELAQTDSKLRSQNVLA